MSSLTLIQFMMAFNPEVLRIVGTHRNPAQFFLLNHPDWNIRTCVIEFAKKINNALAMDKIHPVTVDDYLDKNPELYGHKAGSGDPFTDSLIMSIVISRAKSDMNLKVLRNVWAEKINIPANMRMKYLPYYTDHVLSIASISLMDKFSGSGRDLIQGWLENITKAHVQALCDQPVSWSSLYSIVEKNWPGSVCKVTEPELQQSVFIGKMVKQIEG